MRAQDADVVRSRLSGRGGEQGKEDVGAEAELTFPLGTGGDPLLEGSRGHDGNE